jgi:HEAT repeat protein
LPEFEDKAKPAIPALLKAIETGEVKERLAAMEAVYCIARDQRFTAALIDALKDKETEIRKAAVQRLQMLDRSERSTALSTFVGALQDRDEFVREQAMLALKTDLKELGPKAKDVVPGLIAALKGDKCNELHEVVDMLAEIGPVAKEAVPVLTQLLKTPPPKNRYPEIEAFCLEGYSPERAFQCRVYDALEKIAGKKPSSPRPQPTSRPQAAKPYNPF